MKNNKSPGPDGIVVELYKIYWREIGDDMLNAFKYSSSEENLLHSLYLALIRLIFKKGQKEHINKLETYFSLKYRCKN